MANDQGNSADQISPQAGVNGDGLSDLSPLAILKEQITEFSAGAIAIAPQLVAAIVFLIFVWVLKKVAVYLYGQAVKHSSMRPSLKEAFKTLIAIAIWVTGILIALMIALPGLTPSKLLAGLGIGSIAVGLAFKDIFENFLAGLLILLRKQMRIDDYIECEGISGQVKEISIRDTLIRQTDGVLTLVPNSFIYKNPVKILTDWEQRRITIICGVAYGEDVDHSRDIIRKAVEAVETVNKDKPIQIFAQEFADSSINFEITWWTDSKPVDIRTSRDQVVAAVKRALDEAGIEIPFPYRTLTFKESLQIQNGPVEEPEADGASK